MSLVSVKLTASQLREVRQGYAAGNFDTQSYLNEETRTVSTPREPVAQSP